MLFEGGSIWRPPPMNPYTQGMPEDLVEPDTEPRKGSLSPTQRDRLEDLIRNMTPERLKVAEVMVFCMEHSEAADEICDCIMESLANPSTALPKKVNLSMVKLSADTKIAKKHVLTMQYGPYSHSFINYAPPYFNISNPIHKRLSLN